MLTLPTRRGYVVEVDNGRISRCTGEKVWDDDFYTTDRHAAETRLNQLLSEGKTARIGEAIF